MNELLTGISAHLALTARLIFGPLSKTDSDGAVCRYNAYSVKRFKPYWLKGTPWCSEVALTNEILLNVMPHWAVARSVSCLFTLLR